MTSETMTVSINRTARLAGWLYLALIPFSVLGFFYVPSALIVPGDAATTSRNILTSELVAQSVFGLDVQRRPNRTGEQDAFYNTTPRALSPSWVRVPEYSHGVTASMEVENKLPDWGWRRHSPPPGWRPSPTHVVTVILEHRDKRRVQAVGPFETALCRAALKAVAP